MPKFVPLWTDAAMWLMTLAAFAYAWQVRRSPTLAATWRRVFRDPAALASSVVLLLGLAVTLLDSVHYRPLLPPAPGAAADAPPAYDARTRSLLDTWLGELVASREATYSRPLAYLGFTKESVEVAGQVQRLAPRLKFGGAHLKTPEADWAADVLSRAAIGLAWGALAAAVLGALFVAVLARAGRRPWRATARHVLDGEGDIPWRVAVATVGVICLVAGPATALSGPYHLLGTDLTGNDVLYQALKSVRTAFVIGTLATVATLPLAVVLGIMAGYLKGWVDEAIQYVYTVLSSVPNVLLIAACVLMVQVFLDKHPELFETGAERADLKLFLLCVVLGLTGWAGLARLLRGETLKLRELEYVQAATAFGVGPWRIMVRHVFPNVAHLMLIVTVLEFSALILYEAVLSYVGVGVDPSMNSFGGMINLARNEMSRDPVVWWSFAAAFGFMVALVLAANLFADGVRDAFDPRARAMRPLARRRAIASGGQGAAGAGPAPTGASGTPEKPA
ncbi:MAG: ABC transporter permease [Rubrivivax sp.]|nr:ABC transporter permease [Rubrivivax sp.]